MNLQRDKICKNHLSKLRIKKWKQNKIKRNTIAFLVFPHTHTTQTIFLQDLRIVYINIERVSYTKRI